jgi:hypothetical protein
MRVSLPVSLLAAVFALACEQSAPPPAPMGLAGAPGGAPGTMGAGANPSLPGAVATTQNPHAQPQNPHAGQAQPVAPPNPHGAMPGAPAGGPKASPFPDSAPVVVRADKPAGEPAPLAKGVVSGTVQETMNAAGYTYLRLKNASGGEVWVAITEAKVEIGKNVSVVESLTMTDFHSKALNRTFPSIVFGSLN